MTKTCNTCGETKPVEDFHPRKDSKDGYRSQCKSCRSEQGKMYSRSEHGRGVRRAYQKSEAGKAAEKRFSRTDRGREAQRKSDAKYRTSEHGKKVREAYRKTEAAKNSRDKYRFSEHGSKAIEEHRKSPQYKEALSRADRKYKQTEDGRAVCALKQQRRRARKRNATIAPIDEKKIYALCNNQCVYCGSTEKLTLDHVVALANGGSHTEDNLVVACKSCNSSKGKKPLEEWIATRVKPLADGALMSMEEAV